MGLFWTLFAQIWANMNFPEKRGLSRFFNIPIIYHRAKNQNNLTRHSGKKLLDGHTKNLFIPLISLRDTVSHRVLQLIEKPRNYDWPRAFWAISQEPEFYQICNLFRHTAITVI